MESDRIKDSAAALIEAIGGACVTLKMKKFPKKVIAIVPHKSGGRIVSLVEVIPDGVSYTTQFLVGSVVLTMDVHARVRRLRREPGARSVLCFERHEADSGGCTRICWWTPV